MARACSSPSGSSGQVGDAGVAPVPAPLGGTVADDEQVGPSGAFGRRSRVAARGLLRPAAVAAHEGTGAGRAPGALGVGLDRRVVGEDALDDAPRLEDGVLAGEERRVAVHRLLDQQLVGLGAGVGPLVGGGRQGDGGGHHRLAGLLVEPGDGVEALGLHLDADRVAGDVGVLGDPQRAGRPLELEGHLGDRAAHGLAGPEEERHAAPAGRVDVEAEGGVGLGVGAGLHAGHVEVAVVLAPHEVLGLDDAGGLEDLGLLVAQGLGALVDRLLHAEDGDHLQQVVLHDVAHGADGVVERAAVLDAERLGHGDLHRGHDVAVPERLGDGVGEPGDEQVPRGLLADEVVDAEDRRLGEVGVERGVQVDGRLEVAAERLLDDEPGTLVEAHRGDARGHRPEQERRDGEVEDRVGGAAGEVAFSFSKVAGSA